MLNNVGYLYLPPIPLWSCHFLLQTPQFLLGDPRQIQVPPHNVRNLEVLTFTCLPALTLTIPPHPADKITISLLYHGPRYHFFHTPPPEMPCLPPNAIIPNANFYLFCKTHLKCYILQDTFLVIINSLPLWSTLLVALSWQASHSVMHQSQLPICLVILAGP